MKKLLSLLLVLMMAFTLFGCVDDADTPAPADDPGQEADQGTVEEDSHYPVTIETYNYAGEPIEVTFDKAPEKVVCAYQNNVEIMLRLGLADRVVAAFGLDGPVAEDLTSEFEKINYLEERPTKEEVIALNPDCILGWYSIFADDRFGEVDYWNENGCGTYMSLNSGCRRNQEGYVQTVEDEIQDILNVGKIFNVEEEAQALVDDITNEIDKIEEYTQGVDKVGIAILEDEGDSFRVYGANVLGGNIAMKAGAELVIGAEESENVTAEELIEADPEAIFMVYFFGYLEPEDAVKAITENPKFESLQAVQNDKVFALNLTNVYCSGYRSFVGVRTFAEHIYPELYN